MDLIPNIYKWSESDKKTFISLISSLIYIGAIIGNLLLSKF